MREANLKMSGTELKVEAPLAIFESEDYDENNFDNIINNNRDWARNDNETVNSSESENNFGETFSGSLEDLVTTFDEKVTKCLKDFEETTEQLAPVQRRLEDETTTECHQMWWTLTGNYGSLLPIDWSASPTKKVPQQISTTKMESSLSSHSDYEDEAIASDFDINTNLSHSPQEPLVTADDVIREIDDIMADSSYDSTYDLEHGEEPEDFEEQLIPTPVMPQKWSREDLENLSSFHMKEIVQVLERTVQDFSEVLIAELAHRDELEFSKELKNSFISLLLSVQNRRRQVNVEKNKPPPKTKNGKNDANAKFVTTVIPYQPCSGSPDNKTMQILLKILQAMNEDSPNVPNLLTDYILRGKSRISSLRPPNPSYNSVSSRHSAAIPPPNRCSPPTNRPVKGQRA